MILEQSIFYKNLRVLYDINLFKTDEVHATIVDAIFNALVMVDDDINKARLAMAFQTAEGIWLDVWGEYFGFPRNPGESDDDYRFRIIAEIIEPKVTIPALKNAAARFLNWKYNVGYTPADINIFEPWTKLIKPSYAGGLSTDFYLWSPDYWTNAVIDISIPNSSLITPELVAYLNEVKAAGVQIVWSSRPTWDVIISYFEPPRAYIDVLHERNIIVSYWKLPYLSESFTLSGEHPFIGPDVRLEITRELPPDYVWYRLRAWDWSPVMKLTDIPIMFGKPSAELTLQEIFDRSNQEQTALTSFTNSLHSTYILTTSLSLFFNVFAVPLRSDDSPILKVIRDIGLGDVPDITLNNYLLQSRQLDGYNLIGERLPDGTLAGLSSITLRHVANWESTRITQKQRNFQYKDTERTFQSWLSFARVSEAVDIGFDALQYAWLAANKTEVVNSLIEYESRYENVLAPTQIIRQPA